MFSLSLRSAAPWVLALLGAACASVPPHPEAALEAPRVYYAVTAEIALVRHEARTAALQYTAAALAEGDASVLARACEVTLSQLQPSLAQKVAARWMILYPNALEAHACAARAALELHQVEPASSQYTIVLKKSPRGVDAELVELAGELEAADDVFGAREVAARIAASFPGSAPAAELAGLTAMRADDPTAAVGSLNAALALSEHDTSARPDARHAIIESLWRARVLAGDVAVPLNEARSLAEREPTLGNRLDYALLLAGARHTAAASEELEQLARDPQAAPVALRLLALLEYQDGKLDAAAAHFTQLLTLGKSIDDASYYLGLIAERRGEVDQALRLYAQVQGGEDALSALLRAGGILRSHGEPDEAEELLEHLLEDEPQRAPQILIARAHIDAEAGDLIRAMAVLTEAAEQYPDDVDIRYAIATTYEAQGRVRAALHELKEILVSRPDDPAALNAYGYTLADHHRSLKRAREMIESAHARAPKNSAILDSLGWVEYRQGESAAALDPLSAAFAQDRAAEIGAHLGEVLWSLNRRSEAEKVWDRAAQAEPDNRVLRETRARLEPTAQRTP